MWNQCKDSNGNEIKKIVIMSLGMNKWEEMIGGRRLRNRHILGRSNPTKVNEGGACEGEEWILFICGLCQSLFRLLVF